MTEPNLGQPSMGQPSLGQPRLVHSFLQPVWVGPGRPSPAFVWLQCDTTTLKLDPYEVISENQQKLEARYGEQFEVQRSEVRKEGDL